jgi:parallel beta-helix repeat protein
MLFRGFLRLALFSTCCICLAMQSVQASSVEVPSHEAQTIALAMIKAKVGDTIWVANGVYFEHIFIKSGISLVAQNAFKARLDGGGRGTVVTMGKNSLIRGFEITNGTIGIFSNSAGNVIERCRIVNNWQTGIIVVRHMPKVQDNIIAFNRASGIQGWDVRSTTSSINHNTISFNQNHGIAIGGKSNVIIENNVIAYNERFGIKISDESKGSEITKNNLYRNLSTGKSIPEGNFSFDPSFIAPRAALNFKPDPKYCCKIKGSDNENLGARLDF